MKGRPDHFYRRAQKEGYAARSVFKLEELDRKYRLFKPGHHVIDLGAAPGSWAQYVCGRVGEKGLVVAVDRSPLAEIPPAANVRFLQEDIETMGLDRLRSYAKDYDVVLSDVAPRTTGDPEGDHERSFSLSSRALEIATQVLRPGGTFVCKMYQGPHAKEFVNRMTAAFEFVKSQKPKASRSDSREVFFVAMKRKPG